MSAEIEVTKSFAKALKKNRSLMGAFETALKKICANPLTLDRKCQHGQFPVFSAPLPGTGQGSGTGQKVLFYAFETALIPFAITSNHKDYETTLNAISSGKQRPDTESLITLSLRGINSFGDVGPSNILARMA